MKVKRGLQLSASIISIVFSAILILGSIIILGSLHEPSLGIPEERVTLFKYLYIVVIVFSVANIIISSLICVKPKTGSHTGLCITALVLNALLAVDYIVSNSLFCIVPLICVGFFIEVLCIRGENGVAESVDKPVVETTEVEQPNSIEENN